MAGPEWVDVTVELTAADGTKLRVTPHPDPRHPVSVDVSDELAMHGALAACVVFHARQLRLTITIPGAYTVERLDRPGGAG